MKWKQALTRVSSSVLLLAGMAYAHYTPQVIKVKVPFDFEVNGRLFSAGPYSLVRTEPNMLRLRDENGRSLANILAAPAVAAEVPAGPKLEFRTEGGRHVLSRIWQGNTPYGYEIYRSERAELLARKHHTQPSTVEGP